MWLTKRQRDIPMIWDDFDKVFEGFDKSFSNFPFFSEVRTLETAQKGTAEIVGDNIQITVVAPGMNKEDFNVSLQGKQLIVSYDVSEKDKAYVSQKKYKQIWNIPADTKPTDISAAYEQGILKITLPVGKEEKKQIESHSISVT